MHLTPEQIDRHPFRMTRRGYDIVQVRDFLREIATEMRERQQVRDRLAADVGERDGSPDSAPDPNAQAEAERRAEEIIAAAQKEADELIDGAELRARERSDVVLSEAQARLDQLLTEEREVKARLGARSTPEGVGAVLGSGTTGHDALNDARDRGAQTGQPDTTLADFMKSTLRDEVRPD